MDKTEIRTLFGNGNDFPPNWNEITDQQFWKRWFMYSWINDDWRQIVVKGLK